MKILFQGDSITDMHRDRSDYHNLGEGYPGYAAKFIRQMCPDQYFEFIDLGISGDTTSKLAARIEHDFVEIQPDIVSIMIGINDVWDAPKHNMPTIPDDVFEENYRSILKALKEKTNAKIVILEPFLLPVPDKTGMRTDLDSKIQRIRKLAREFADLYIPTDGLLAAATTNVDYLKFAEDGVHPVPYGAQFIGLEYAKAVMDLILQRK